MLDSVYEESIPDLECLFEQLEINNWVDQLARLTIDNLEDYVENGNEENDNDPLNFEIPNVELPHSLKQQFDNIIAQDCCKKSCLTNINPTPYVLQAFLDLRQMNSKRKLQLLIYTMSLGVVTNPKRWRYSYALPFIGPVCKSAFMAFWGYGDKPIKRCSSWMQKGRSILAPVHKNAGNSHNHLSTATVNSVKSFLSNLGRQSGEDRAIRKYTRQLVDGSYSVNYEKIDYIYLPSHYSQNKILMLYNHLNPNNIVKSRSALIDIWHNDENLKKIIIRSPSKNECDDCTVLRINLVDATTTPANQELQEQVDRRERMVQETGIKIQNHISHYRDLRANYESDIQRCKNGNPTDLAVICFDYAQNVQLPFDPQTPSGVYFLSLLNVYQFGIVNERIGVQEHFIYTEGKAGKGSNEVASMIMKYLDRNFINTHHLCFWADNCGGQNKNTTMLFLMAYLVIFGTTSGHVFQSIEYKFQVKGHTRNSVDRGFGQCTNVRKNTPVWAPSQYHQLINTIKGNMCTNLEKETFYDWTSYLNQFFNKPTGIQKYQIFKFQKEFPAIMLAKTNTNSEWTTFNLLKKDTQKNFEVIINLQPLPNKGLNIEKQKDLYDKVRKFIPTAYRDEICPKPDDSTIQEVKDLKNNRRKRVVQENALKHKRLFQ